VQALWTAGSLLRPLESADLRRRRVAVFSDALPERNGAGSYYEDLVAQLRPYVDRIGMFRPARRPRPLRLALPLPGDPTQKLILPDVPRLARRLRRLQPDVVVSVTPGPFGLLGLYHARRSGAAFLTGFHTHFERLMELYGDTLFYRLARGFLETTNTALCSASDAVLVLNRDLAATVRRLGAREIEVMGTPLSPEFLEKPPLEPSGPLRNVLFAGRLAPEKNLEAVVEAARRLPHLRFTLAGDGPLRSRLERDARHLPNVRLTGWLERRRLREEMDAAGLLLLPSHFETFGTVALEAMARGRPALVSEGAGIHHWEVLSDALLVLERGACLASVLGELGAAPAAFWKQKAVAARAAAEALHAATLEQWADCVERYAEGRDGS